MYMHVNSSTLLRNSKKTAFDSVTNTYGTECGSRSTYHPVYENLFSREKVNLAAYLNREI